MKAKPITQRVKPVAKQVKSGAEVENPKFLTDKYKNIGDMTEEEALGVIERNLPSYDLDESILTGEIGGKWTDNRARELLHRQDSVATGLQHLHNLNRNKPVAKQTVKKLKSEHSDTWIYKGDVPHEQVIDLEDRIGFIKEDISNKGKASFRQQRDLKKLNKALNKIKTKMETGPGSYGNEEWDKE